MIKLKRLLRHLPDIEVKGSKEIEITGICSHSKLVAPGNLFIAKKGLTHDGNLFIADAIHAGAAALLTDLYNPFVSVTQLIHPDVAKMEAKLAAEYFQNPSREMQVIGITGTSGKSTTSYLVKYLLDHVGISTGLIGTIEWIIGENRYPAKMTCPDVITNHKFLREMVQQKCSVAVMEVTSHALDQNRTGEIDFSLAVFTNFSQDHLDYHKSMEEYKKAKEKLFTQLTEKKTALLNADDPCSAEFAKKTKAKVMTYGILQPADLQAKDLSITDKGSQFTLCYQGQEFVCQSHLIGRFNVYNLLAAIAIGIHLSIPVSTSVSILKNFKYVRGRLERVENRLGIHIFVDFSHKEDALYNVLSTLNSIKKGKVITLFGCGGDRDQSKREKMGKVVCQLSDEAILTNDNPRSEDPMTIVSHILQGFSSSYPVTIELDRKKAIEKAIEKAHKGDIVLIAGKGHEQEQIFASQVFSFSDVETARQICLAKEKR